MGRLFCNGKRGFCERVHGTAEECEKVSCTGCEFADGTGAKFVDKITNYDRIRNMSIDEMVCAIRNQIACGSDFGRAEKFAVENVMQQTQKHVLKK